MSEEGSTADPGETRVTEDALAGALDALERGGERELGAYLDAHPDQRATVLRRLELLRRSGLVDEGEGDAFPERLGDFRLLERLGQGGMGVVYRAEQVSVGREVALKLVRPELLYYDGARERFEREVAAIANLQHPGIVALYAVGEADGVPFYAMELVRGATIEERLQAYVGRDPRTLTGRDLDPDGAGETYLFADSWTEASVRVVRQVSEALGFVHRSGFVHRDVKPSNVMLTSEGTSRALLLDFGLATSEASTKLTRTGSQVGSLRYMAPEQLEGRADLVGPRTDVYALGITLYEMLSLTPAFEAGSQARLISAIGSGALPPLRERAPGVSWELEAVCATATDPDPARRYPDAAAFARDLGNVLEHRPIEARRAGALLRLRRWAQRRPAAATALALGSLILVGGPALFAWQSWRSSKAIAAERDVAVENLESALEAVERMLTRVGEVDLVAVPSVGPVRQALLEDAIELLERIVARADDPDHAAEFQLAEAFDALAAFHADMARPSAALPPSERALELFEALAARGTSDPSTDARVAVRRLEALANHASHLTSAGELERARELFERVGAELDALEAEAPDDPNLAQVRARNDLSHARALEALGSLEEAQALLVRADETQRRALEAAGDGASTDQVRGAFAASNELGLFHLQHTVGDGEVPDQVMELLDGTVALGERLVVRRDATPTDRRALATAWNNLGGGHRRNGDPEATLDAYLESEALCERLVRDFPSSSAHRFELATITNQLAILHPLEDPAHEPYAARAMALFEQLTHEDPGHPTYHERYAIAVQNYSVIPLNEQRYDECLELLGRSIAAMQRARELAPDQADLDRALLNLVGSKWVVQQRQGDHAAMRETAEEMVRAVPDAWLAHHRAVIALDHALQVVESDGSLGDAERAELEEAIVARGVEWTNRVMELDPPYKDQLRKLFDFRWLHGRPAFETMMERWE